MEPSHELGRRAGLRKRDFLKAGAVAMGATILPFRSGFAAQEPEAWTIFRSNARDFLKAAIRLNFTTSWDGEKPIYFDILPPASETEIAAVESQIGEPLPKTLRQFYANCSAGVDIRWLMPARMERTAKGFNALVYEEKRLPPPPFREIKQVGIDEPRLGPTIIGGHLIFSLADTAAQVADTRASAAGFRKAAAGDPDTSLHYRRHAEWWERGFPLGLDGGGNMIAIDKQDEAGRMMLLAHDGTDEPGFFIEHDLLGFMLLQSRLGFTGFGGFDYQTFYDRGVQPGDRQRRYLAERPGDVEAGLALPSTYRIEDESDEARIWRDWLGLKQG